jgi:hypothetical protein
MFDGLLGGTSALAWCRSSDILKSTAVSGVVSQFERTAGRHRQELVGTGPTSQFHRRRTGPSVRSLQQLSAKTGLSIPDLTRSSQITPGRRQIDAGRDDPSQFGSITSSIWLPSGSLRKRGEVLSTWGPRISVPLFADRFDRLVEIRPWRMSDAIALEGASFGRV